MLKIEKPRGPVSEAQLAAVEARLGIRLPDQYRTLLLETGGGYFGDEIPIPGRGDNGLLLGLVGVDDLPVVQRSGFHEVVPERYLMIGNGAGGSLNLRISEGDEGSIWWADYDQAEDIGAEEPTEDVMHRLADTLDEFLQSLP